MNFTRTTGLKSNSSRKAKNDVFLAGMTLHFPCTPRYATRARKAFALLIERTGIANNLQLDLEQAVGEALVNTVRHGSRSATHFEVRVRMRRSLLRIDVENDGLSLSPHDAAPDETPGMDIGIMRKLVDSIAFFNEGRALRIETRLTPEFVES
jgi:anti-sigma regulatory factor (Ser/Thr protein kinase)